MTIRSVAETRVVSVQRAARGARDASYNFMTSFPTWPDGRAVIIAFGLTTARWRSSHEPYPRKSYLQREANSMCCSGFASG